MSWENYENAMELAKNADFIRLHMEKRQQKFKMLKNCWV